MKHVIYLCSVLITIGLLPFRAVAQPAASAAPSGIGVTGYYPGYEQDRLPVSKIDFTALTHLVHFSVMPKSDGSLDTARFDISAARSAAIITATHKAGRKVLLCVGGANSVVDFRGAISAAHCAQFVQNLVDIVITRGYDGLDIDMEPMEAADKNDYIAFITELHSAMNAAKPGLLLTAAVGDDPQIFLPIKTLFDHINIMTYGMSNTWQDWVTWHSSPLYNGNFIFPHSPRQLPSAQLWVNKWLDAGFNPRQLGIGIAFYSIVWKGAFAPRQSIVGVTTSNSKYQATMKLLEENPSYYHWDDVAQVPYLSIDLEGNANDKFITYDNDKSIQKKIDYVRANHLGGVIIWNLSDGYRTDVSTGQDELLQAVKHAAFGK